MEEHTPGFTELTSNWLCPNPECPHKNPEPDGPLNHDGIGYWIYFDEGYEYFKYPSWLPRDFPQECNKCLKFVHPDGECCIRICDRCDAEIDA